MYTKGNLLTLSLLLLGPHLVVLMDYFWLCFVVTFGWTQGTICSARDPTWISYMQGSALPVALSLPYLYSIRGRMARWLGFTSLEETCKSFFKLVSTNLHFSQWLIHSSYSIISATFGTVSASAFVLVSFEVIPVILRDHSGLSTQKSHLAVPKVQTNFWGLSLGQLCEKHVPYPGHYLSGPFLLCHSSGYLVAPGCKIHTLTV